MTPALEPGSFEDLYRNAPFGYVTLSLDGTITQINDTLLAWSGLDESSAIGRSFTDLLDPPSRLFYETRQQPTLHLQGSVNEVALTLLGADGTALPVMTYSVVVPGGVRIALGAAAERQQYERALLLARRAAEQSETRVRVLQRASAAFVASVSVTELVEALAESARTAFDARVVVLLPDEAGVLTPVTDDRVSPADRPVQPDGPAARAWASVQPVVISGPDEIERDFPGLVEVFRDARVEAVIAVPMLDDRSPVGVLLCMFGRARTLDPDALELQSALARLAAQTIARLRLQDAMAELAMHDQLTGLGNRILLQERATRAIGRAREGQHPLAVMFFDLDGFKAVNDSLGHGAGDAVLQRVAARVAEVVRGDDFVARFGGDEFVVICEDADEAQAVAIAERIRATIAEPLGDIGVAIPITSSVGVVLLDSAAAAALSPEQLLVRADAAMYASKNGGRNRVTLDVVR